MIRVFPRRTSLTPDDPLAFVGDPPLLRPEGDEVHISVTFTWDVPEALRLRDAWAQHYPVVRIGGPAMGTRPECFEPGLYVKWGVTTTSRGCNNHCPWCLVPAREGRLRELPHIADGNIVQDNNFLQCSAGHRRIVYEMLARQPRAAVFSGGIDARLVTPETAAELRDLRIGELFLAADTEGSLSELERAVNLLHFLPRRKLRCYTLLAYRNDTPDKARARLERAWRAGVMPFAQLFQPQDRRVEYGKEWRHLAREWSRPAAMKAQHREIPA